MELKINRLRGKENLGFDFAPNTLKVIPGYPDYCIDIFGNVISNKWPNKPKVMKKRLQNKTVLAVCLDSENGVKKSENVRRLVWKTFKGEIPKGKCIIHKSCDIFDDSLSNLKIGKPQKSLGAPVAKKYEGRTVAEYSNCKEAAKKENINIHTLRARIRNKTKINGYTFEFLKEL